MSLKSTVGVAKTGTTSLRATIPEGIVAFLELKAGDKLDWRMDMNEKHQRIVIIRKQNEETYEPRQNNENCG